jgi:uncharacterized damage-inducible protein DinB
MKLTIIKALEVLQQTPNTLISLLSNLSKEWTLANEGEKTWSSYDVIGHLIHGEKTDWILRLNIILLNNNKNFTPFDRFAQFENSKEKTIQELLLEFKTLRVQNIKYLKSLKLSEEQLKLTGIHPEFGSVTVKELLAAWVTHDLGHIAQISRVIAKQYNTEVGPWKAYISILKD